MRWTRKADIEPMLAVNLGTRGLQEAMDLLEYCNHSGGTALSDLRRSHGAEEPYGVRTWCLGNEMDGPWQLGHKPAQEYGRIAAETARAMRQLDPDLKLIACGSSYRHMPTFGAWESTVLEQAYDAVDFISAHAYYENVGDAASFLASSVNLEDFILDVIATADHVRAKMSRRKRIDISFDEWNVWYVSRMSEQVPRDWTEAPRISEEAYSVMDAVVVGSLLITLLRHSDRVTVACQAQLVNTIASIRAEPGGPAWRQTIFHPFAQAARLSRGHVLQAEVRSPVHETAEYGDVPTVDAVVVNNEETGDLAVFAVNRSQDEPVELEVDLRGFPGLRVEEATVLADRDHLAANTVANPDRVGPRRHQHVDIRDNRLLVVLPPVSWNAVRLVGGGMHGVS
jgi:alpha-N-arabinofuranosidase